MAVWPMRVVRCLAVWPMRAARRLALLGSGLALLTGLLAMPAAGAAPLVRSVSLGTSYSCALTRDGEVWCWGENISNELGNLDRVAHRVPVRVVRNGSGEPLSGVRLLSSGGFTVSCAVLVDDTVWCWGGRAGGSVDELGARQETGLPGIVQLSVGDHHRCAVTDDRAAWCWEANDHGQIGDGTFDPRSNPTRILSEVRSIVADGDGTCALRTDGSVWCWGENSEGEVGDGSTSDRPSPVAVLTADGGTLSDVRWLGEGYGYHRCAARTDSTVWCWGANGVGQLGDGTTRELQKAVRVRASRRGPAFTGARRVATGFGYSCSIQRNATVRCWGWNEYGQIGDRTFSLSRPFPTAVTQYPRPRLRDVVQLAAGTAHTCAVVRDGSAWCWGTNGSGELGGVSTTPRIATAVRVRFPESAER